MSRLEAIFPGLVNSGFQITSPPDRQYNCIAWAAGVMKQWWWPDPSGRFHWPAGIPCEETLSAFEELFRSLGYAACGSEDAEAGIEKIAVFADDQGVPTHAARQLSTGRWSSKLGELEDIEHNLHDLDGVEYGRVALVMKRPFVLPA